MWLAKSWQMVGSVGILVGSVGISWHFDPTTCQHLPNNECLLGYYLLVVGIYIFNKQLLFVMQAVCQKYLSHNTKYRKTIA